MNGEPRYRRNATCVALESSCLCAGIVDVGFAAIG